MTTGCINRGMGSKSKEVIVSLPRDWVGFAGAGAGGEAMGLTLTNCIMSKARLNSL